jgi:hypothetical protein
MSADPAKKVPRTDPDAALEALKRARKRAEEIAAQTGTAIIQWENGKVVRIYPGRDDQSR